MRREEREGEGGVQEEGRKNRLGVETSTAVQAASGAVT